MVWRLIAISVALGFCCEANLTPTATSAVVFALCSVFCLTMAMSGLERPQ